MSKSRKNRVIFILSGFILGFVISLTGMTVEDYQHQIGLQKALGQLHHFIAPTLIGVFSAVAAYIFWMKREEQINTAKRLSTIQSLSQIVLSHIAEVVLIINEKLEIVYISNNIQSQFGWGREELLNMELKSLVNQEDYPQIHKEILELIGNEKKSINARFRFKSKFEDFRSVQITASNFMSHPDIKGVLISFKDVTRVIEGEQAVIKSESKYKTLYDNMTDVVCLLNTDKIVTGVNEAGLDLFEYSKEEIIGMSIDKFIYKDDKDLSNTYFEKLEHTGAYNLYEGRIVTKTGKIKWIQVNSTEYSLDGNEIGYQDIIRDITQRKAVEIELQNTVAKLNKSLETRDILFSIIAHDLRAPFANVAGLSEILDISINKNDSAKSLKLNESIKSTANYTLDLLDNLLNWTKAQNDKFQAKKELINLSLLVNDILRIHSIAIKLKNITIVNSISDSQGLNSDSNMLNVILRNLISNALKFTDKDGQITISSEIKNEFIEISVRDNGVGMKPEAVAEIFYINKKITRGTANEKGSGLGLILCKEFAEINGGSIKVNSRVGEGSEFIVSLPFKAKGI